MSSLNTNDLRRIFEKLDQNGDGLVSLDELNCLLQRIGVHYSLEELESVVEKPSLDFSEFLFFSESILSSSDQQKDNASGKKEEDQSPDDHQEEEESDIFKAFNVFDLNGDGFISSEELQSVLARLGLWDETSGKDCRNMIYVYDTNSDGLLDFQEFKNMMC